MNSLIKTQEIIFLFLWIFVVFQMKAQEVDVIKLEHGFTINTSIDSDDDFTFKVKGFGVEGGYYFLKKLGNGGMISVDFRLAYAQSERHYYHSNNIPSISVIRDTITTLRNGIVKYKNISLSIPLKYRYQFSKKVPIHIMVGFNPYFNFLNFSVWKYDEFEYNRVTDMNVSDLRPDEEVLKQKFYSRDLIITGLGYIKDKLMFEIYFSGGTTFFDNEYIKGMDKLSINLNAYYRLD